MVEGGSFGRVVWPKVDDLSWIGDGCVGHFENAQGNWVNAVPIDTKPPRVKILDAEPPSPFNLPSAGPDD